MASAYQRADTLRARRSGRYTSLRDGRTTNEEWSVLASVMGVTQETVNHRRVVQEVWEDRVLHKLLGIEDILATPSKSKEYPQETGVAGVWEADETASDSSESSSDDSDTSQRSKKRKRVPTQTTDHRDEEDEEESRYRIKKDAKAGGPPRKRIRVGAEVDAHPNATTEEDEEYGGSIDSDNDSEEVEDGEVAEAKVSRSGDREKSTKRRSYWLSKAMGLSAADSD
jgi:non-canonical poly(A) RNA polymerase PAPD5/7